MQGGLVHWGICTGTLPHALPIGGLVLDPDPTPTPSPWRRARRAPLFPAPHSGAPSAAAQGRAVFLGAPQFPPPGYGPSVTGCDAPRLCDPGWGRHCGTGAKEPEEQRRCKG